jgi:hypothetical protein
MLFHKEASRVVAAARNSAFLLEFVCICSSMSLLKKDLNRPVA